MASLLNISALIALLPATLLPFRRAAPGPDLAFWSVLLVAIAGPAAVSAVQLSEAWQSDLSLALWLSVAASAALFALLALLVREAWRLAPLLLPYLLLLGLLATLFGTASETTAAPPHLDTWLVVHIAIALIAYGLLTLAAVAGASVFLQERALKAKRPLAIGERLPSIADSQGLQVLLLKFSAALLAAGIVSGMAESYVTSGRLLEFDHKSLLSFLALALVGVLLFLHHRTGLRGQRAARLILIAYLLVTLAYPGVKFVTDVLMG